MSDPISEAIADPVTYAHPAVYHELFARIRRETPVRWTTPSRTRPFWVVSKHADLLEVERQPKVFLSGPRLELFSIQQEDRIMAATGGSRSITRTLLSMDGDEHQALRRLTQSWFMPANLKKLEESVSLLAQEYVDKLAHAGNETDFVHLVSEWYPLRVIMRVLGLPPEDATELLRLTKNFVGRGDARVSSTDGAREDIIVKAAHEIFEYFGNVYNDRLKSPRDDVATIIARAQVDGEPIGKLEAMSYYLLLGLAGHDTTNGTLAGGLLALIQHPDQLAKLQADPSLLAKAVDEMLRWESPTKTFFRTASADYVLRGQKITSGDSLMLCYWSANRDEEVFTEPFSFKVDRSPNPQASFGYGPHVCLGQHLAKIEIRSLFRELLPRIEHIDLAGVPTWVAGTTSAHLHNLPIRYTLRPKEEAGRRKWAV